MIPQNLTTTNQRNNGKSKYDRKLTKIDVVTAGIRRRVNEVLIGALIQDAQKISKQL